MTTPPNIPLAERTDPLIGTIPVGMFNIHRLRYVVQWAIDEYRFAHLSNEAVHWNQGTWGAVNERILPTDADDEVVESVRGERFVPLTCATACCIAGNAVLSAGDKFLMPEDAYRVGVRDRDDNEIEVSDCLARDGEVYRISERGTHLLGITEEEADYLFSGGNDVYDVCYYAEWVAQQYGTHLDLPDAEDYINKRVANSGEPMIEWPVA